MNEKGQMNAEIKLDELLKIVPLTVETDGSGLVDRRGCSMDAESHKAVAAAANALPKLVEAIADHIIEMDKVMKGPSTYQRGVAIANLVGKLQTALQLVEPARDGGKG